MTAMTALHPARMAGGVQRPLTSAGDWASCRISLRAVQLGNAMVSKPIRWRLGFRLAACISSFN